MALWLFPACRCWRPQLQRREGCGWVAWPYQARAPSTSSGRSLRGLIPPAQAGLIYVTVTRQVLALLTNPQPTALPAQRTRMVAQQRRQAQRPILPTHTYQGPLLYRHLISVVPWPFFCKPCCDDEDDDRLHAGYCTLQVGGHCTPTLATAPCTLHGGHCTLHTGCRWEAGVHRVQRVPQTEMSGRLHTSTASVVVLPDADEVIGAGQLMKWLGWCHTSEPLAAP